MYVASSGCSICFCYLGVVKLFTSSSLSLSYIDVVCILMYLDVMPGAFPVAIMNRHFQWCLESCGGYVLYSSLM